MSFRKSFSDASAPAPAPSVQALLAHCSKAGSWVTPRSSVIGSKWGGPGELRAGGGRPAGARAGRRATRPAQAGDEGPARERRPPRNDVVEYYKGGEEQ